jgi:hypothetical protein
MDVQVVFFLLSARDVTIWNGRSVSSSETEVRNGTKKGSRTRKAEKHV